MGTGRGPAPHLPPRDSAAAGRQQKQRGSRHLPRVCVSPWDGLADVGQWCMPVPRVRVAEGCPCPSEGWQPPGPHPCPREAKGSSWVLSMTAAGHRREADLFVLRGAEQADSGSNPGIWTTFPCAPGTSSATCQALCGKQSFLPGRRLPPPP